MNKTFRTIPGEVIPPPATDESAKAHGFSDRYYAKIESVSGEIKRSIVSWNFKNSVWKSPIPGLVKVIEYYDEI